MSRFWAGGLGGGLHGRIIIANDENRKAPSLGKPVPRFPREDKVPSPTKGGEDGRD
tara:strand:- start:741 stop:908 length:168 start_codon:yes stop_codon:yes gene_type:complete